MAEKNEPAGSEKDAEGARRAEGKPVYDIKQGVTSKLRPILLTSAGLALTVLAAAAGFIYNLDGAGSSGYGLPVFMGGLTLLGWLGLTLLSIVKRDALQSKIIAVIFGVSFVGFLALMLSGVGGDRVEITAMVFGALSIPYFAIYTMFEALGMSTGGVIFTTAIVYVAFISVNVWNCLRLRKLSDASKKAGEKQGFSLRMFGDGGRREDDKNKW